MDPAQIQPQLQNLQSAPGVEETTGVANKTFLFNIGNFQIAPTYWQAGAIIFLLFLLVLTLARLRHVYVGWSLKGFLPSVMFGFVLALIVEGFLIMGGKTLLTELLGWENAPKPISTALDEGRYKLIQVMGVEDEIPRSSETVNFKQVVGDYQTLSDQEAEKARLYICEP